MNSPSDSNVFVSYHSHEMEISFSWIVQTFDFQKIFFLPRPVDQFITK
jgi:hypothetical protein